MNKLEIIYKRTTDLIPYEKNPRNNDNAVQYVKESIEQFGFKVPIVIDCDGVIVAGHTRWKAALELNIEELPCVIAADLTEAQIKAFRLADNKTAEVASWDFEALDLELADIDIDMSIFGFNEVNIDWANVEDLTEENYEQPVHEMLICPKCGHIDRKIHFKSA